MNENIISIIEDHVRICDVLAHISHAINSGGVMPNYVPVMNDASISDMLTDIIRRLERGRV